MWHGVYLPDSSRRSGERTVRLREDELGCLFAPLQQLPDATSGDVLCSSRVYCDHL